MSEIPLEVCQQMYKALLRVSHLPGDWGGKEVRKALDAACVYFKADDESA